MKNKYTFLSFMVVFFLVLVTSCSNLWSVRDSASITFEIKNLEVRSNDSIDGPRSIDGESETALVKVSLIDASTLKIIAVKSEIYGANGVVVRFDDLPIIGKTIFARLELLSSDGHFVGISNTRQMVSGENVLTIGPLSEVETDDNDDDDDNDDSGVEYKITYHLDGGENHDDNPDEYTSGERTIVLENATRDGFNFGGWWTEDGTADNDWGEQKTIIREDSTGDIVLYARWFELNVLPIPTDIPQVYTGSELTYSLSGFDATKMNIDGEVTETDAGEYTVIISLIDEVNYNWSDGFNDPKTVTWTITKKPVGKAIISSSVYTGEAQLPLFDTFDESIMQYDSADAGKQEAGTHYVTVLLKAPNNYMWEGGSSDSIEVAWIITQAANSWAVPPSIADWEVGQSPSDPLGTAKFGDVLFTYKEFGGAGAGSETVPTEAGEYTLVATVVETNNYEGLTATVDFTVNEGLDPGLAFAKIFNEDAYEVSSYTGSAESIEIPAMYDGSNGNFPVKEIGWGAFENKTTIKSIVLPEGLTTISNEAFSGCTNLETINIPSTVSGVIGSSAFANCLKITTVVIPQGVTQIGNSSFKGCSALSNVTLHDGIISLGSDSFMNCTSLQTFNIPANITDLPSGIFSGCTALQEITLTTDIETVSATAFSECSNLTVTSPYAQGSEPSGWEAGWDTGITVDRPSSGGDNATITYEYHTQDNYYIVNGVDTSTGTNVVIPSSHDNGTNGLADVGKIAASVFTNNTVITSVSILGSLMTLPDDVFNGCTSLQSATISDSVTYLGARAFKGTTALKTVAIGEKVTTIHADTFMNSGIETITIPSTVTVINSGAFEGSALTSVSFPDAITVIKEDVFKNCKSLQTVVFSPYIEEIQEAAFQDCTSLGVTTIPTTVTKIGVNAFNGCTSINIYTTYTEANKPDGWNSLWANAIPTANIHWGDSAP